MKPTRTISALLASGVLLFAACGDDDDSGASDQPAEQTDESAAPDGSDSGGGDNAGGGEVVTEIEIADFEYAPADATVEAGAEITFTNADDTAHTATASDGPFNTESIGGGEEGTITAPDEPGEYAYICAFHPFMKGTLVVE